MSILKFIKSFLATPEPHDETIIPYERNEPCFCNSGLKYKKCHALKLEPHDKIACKIIDNQTHKTRTKIFRRSSTNFSSILTWNEIGVGKNEKLE